MYLSVYGTANPEYVVPKSTPTINRSFVVAPLAPVLTASAPVLPLLLLKDVALPVPPLCVLPTPDRPMCLAESKLMPAALKWCLRRRALYHVGHLDISMFVSAQWHVGGIASRCTKLVPRQEQEDGRSTARRKP